eukprot:1684743-Rhodomonas_salina.1
MAGISLQAYRESHWTSETRGPLLPKAPEVAFSCFRKQRNKTVVNLRVLFSCARTREVQYLSVRNCAYAEQPNANLVLPSRVPGIDQSPGTPRVGIARVFDPGFHRLERNQTRNAYV